MNPALLLATLACIAVSTVSQADPPELKAHRDAKTKQELQTFLDRQDTNLAWRLKHFDANHDGLLDQQEVAAEKAAKDKQLAELQKRLEQREQARRAQGELTRWDRNRNGRLDPPELAAQRRHDEQVKQDLLKKQERDKSGKAEQRESAK